MRKLRILIASIALLAAPFAGADTNYRQTIEQWREQREAALKADDGWLTVAGLFWLHEGDNVAGSDSHADIRLPRGTARVCTFHYRAGKVEFEATGAAMVLVNGKPAMHARLRSDEDGASKPDLVTVGDFTMFVIHRGARDAIRLRDQKSELRAHFSGLRWYPVREAYRVIARWVAYPSPKQLSIPNILGETERAPSPGYAVFTLNGREYQLHPVVEDNELFFIFRDETAGQTTYPSGRFFFFRGCEAFRRQGGSRFQSSVQSTLCIYSLCDLSSTAERKPALSEDRSGRVERRESLNPFREILLAGTASMGWRSLCLPI